MLWSMLVPFLVYWLVVFVVSYMLVEYGQGFLYDEATPHVGLKVGLGSLLLAALMAWSRPSFETMFTDDIAWTVLQVIAWFAVFTLLYQFQPLHAFSISSVTMLLVAGIASLGVDSMTRPRPHPGASALTSTTRKPIRAPLGPPRAPAKAEPTPPGR